MRKTLIKLVGLLMVSSELQRWVRWSRRSRMTWRWLSAMLAESALTPRPGPPCAPSKSMTTAARTGAHITVAYKSKGKGAG